MDDHISRRAVLGASWKAGVATLILGGGAPLLGACARPSSAKSEPGPYAVWRELQAALRKSPDHAAGRARALVEAGDIAAMHRFVRDEIRLVSGHGERFVLGGAVRWGRRAALRAGAGTAREKAEILAEMIRQTGREAEVVEIDGPTRAETPGLFFRETEQVFDPPVSKDQLDDWRRRLGAPSPEARVMNVGEAEGRVAALSEQLRGIVGQDELDRVGRHAFDDRPYGRVPVVKIADAERGPVYADPVRPGAELTALGETVREYPASAPEGMLPVSIRLSATTTDDADEPFELARADWTADDVAGRQVRIGFKPFGETLGVLASRIGDLRAFTPVLAIQALDEDGPPPERAMIMGESVTLEGDRIALADSGDVLLNGDNLGDGSPSGNAGKVTSIEVEADASTYPDMTIRLRPRDAEGRIVDALSAADFAFKDEGEAVHCMLRSRDRAPRILFLADSSFSMPRAFLGNGPAMQALADRVDVIAKAVHPAAKVSMQKTDSNLWEQLLKAARAPYDLIVYATDGDLDGRRPTEADLAVLAAGPKAIILNVRGDLAEKRERYGAANIFDAMASATGGEAVDVSDDDTRAAEEVIRTFLNTEGSNLPYVLSYRVIGGEPGERTAAATIGSAQGSTVYTARADAVRGRKLASLMLTVNVGGREMTRVLAGQDGADEVRQAQLDDVQGAMFGTFVVSLEGPPPSLSTVLDDFLSAKLSVETLDRAVGKADADVGEMIDALDAGIQVLPGELATLMSRSGRMSGADFAFAEQGMRCILFSARPVINSDRVLSRIDIMPVSRACVLSSDRSVLIERAFETSLSLAAAEGMLFPVSTQSVLADKPLAIVDVARFRERGLDPDAIRAWDAFLRAQREIIPHPGVILVGAEDGSTQACWAISRETGEIYALLPDGSGGGEYAAHIQKQLEELDRVISMMNLLMTAVDLAVGLNPIGGFALGIVAVYGQNLARMYAAVTMSIILMDASGIEPALKRALANMACEIDKSLVLAVFSGAGKIASRAVTVFTTAENVVGMAGGSSPFSCPM